MTIQQLRCFWTVVTTGSFTEAGEVLHMSQSTLSKKIMALEQELGIELLTRNGKRFSISPDGRTMMQYFAIIIEAHEQIMQVLDEIRTEQEVIKPEIKLVVVPAVANYGIMPLMNFFAKDNPDIILSFDEMDEDRLLLLLQSGYCDLAFCSDICLDEEHYGMQYYCSEDFLVALSPSNPLTKRSTIEFADLQDQKLIFNRRESQLYDLCMNACLEAGFEPNVVMTTSNPNIAMDQILYNDNYTYVGMRAALERRMPSSRCQLVGLRDSPSFNFVFAWRKDKPLSPTARGFLKYARKDNDI